MTKPTILVLLGCFNSASMASGPNQSMIENARALAAHFRFRVIGHQAEGEELFHWHQFEGIERMAVPPGLAPRQLRRVLRQTEHDLMVCNGFFDPRLTIPALAMRRFGMIPPRPTLVAPRGEFSPGALALKGPRKKIHLAAARVLGLLRGVHVQATDEAERRAIQAAIPAIQSILIGPNVRRLAPLPAHSPRGSGEPLRIAFLSRIDRKKNLHVAIDLLGKSTERLQFDIFGPVSDHAYWRECTAALGRLPANVSATYQGAVPPDRVVDMLARYDLMLFPTAGENYGHAIVDSLAAGTPVLISDQTPWTDLEEEEAGVSLPLPTDRRWLDWIDRFSRMDEKALAQWRQGARAYVERKVDSHRDAEELRRCFTMAITTPAGSGRRLPSQPRVSHEP